MLAKSHWQQLIPHAGAMCLLETVVAWDDLRIHARADSHRDPHNPLREVARLHAVHLCEYAAQAMAIHGGLCAQRDAAHAPPGLLVALHAVTLHVPRIDDLPGALDVHAEQLLAGAAGTHYAFRVEHAGHVLAEGRAAIMHAV
jgi:predicted hotdog family 3-hydroxylacyl-ACP dehydratase